MKVLDDNNRIKKDKGLNINKDINKLIKKYQDGNTNGEEEYILSDLFGTKVSNDVPKDLENKISCLIDRWEKEENESLAMDIKPKSARHRLTPYYIISGIAASVVLCIGVISYNYLNSPEEEANETSFAMKDTFDNPHDAYIETQKTLHLFASVLNKGTSKLEKAEHINKDVRYKINKSIKNGF